MPGTVYILTNRPNGTLYTGVTANLARRIFEHREGPRRQDEDIRTAIQRESNIKHYSRAWKVRLILEMNPAWDDLCNRLNW